MNYKFIYGLKHYYHFVPFFEDSNGFVESGFFSEDALNQLKIMFLRICQKHFGFYYDDDDSVTEYFCNNTALLRVQPVMGAHVINMPVSDAVNYVKNQNKKNVLLFGLDEQLQDFALDKVHTIATLLKDTHEEIYYITDDLEGAEIYKEYCRIYNTEPAMKIFSGIHTAVHDIADATPYRAPNSDLNNRPYKYLFYSRMPRSHRLCMLGYLAKNNLIEQGLISANQDTVDVIGQFRQNDMEYINDLLPGLRDLYGKEHLFPRVIDLEDLYPDHEHGVNICSVLESNFEARDSSYFSLVSETVFWKEAVYPGDMSHIGGRSLTEKTFKPIFIEHPFVLLSHAGSLSELRSRGFKTFSDFWDESYDDCTSDIQRLTKVQELAKHLCAKSNSEWDDIYKDLAPILKHNRELVSTPPLNFTNNVEVRELHNFITGKGTDPQYA